ncbi:hypothetical protein ACQ86B_13670 [Mycolicibacterium aichiense]|uniref:hypothetical protein n=1 Tax=Mycolicibacterium aichiense TaxID=1799 RepID=UPI003D670D06
MPKPELVTLVVDDGQGGRESLVLSGPGGEVRFTVGDSSNHAGVWKIWATSNNASVYAAVRVLGGRLKISLHDGPYGPDYRLQWTEQHMQANPEFANRIIDKWNRPPEIGHTGWTKGISVWVRHQDVIPAPEGESLPADVLFLPAPKEGRATGVHIVIAHPTGQFVRPGGTLLGGVTLADGQVALIIVSQDDVAEETNLVVDQAVADLLQLVTDPLDEGDTYRSLVWRDGADGDRQVWDVGVRP